MRTSVLVQLGRIRYMRHNWKKKQEKPVVNTLHENQHAAKDTQKVCRLRNDVGDHNIIYRQLQRNKYAIAMPWRPTSWAVEFRQVTQDDKQQAFFNTVTLSLPHPDLRYSVLCRSEISSRSMVWVLVIVQATSFLGRSVRVEVMCTI